MALIKCSECGKEISDKAASCPHCGCPMETHPREQEDTGGKTKCPKCGEMITPVVTNVGGGSCSVGSRERWKCPACKRIIHRSGCFVASATYGDEDANEVRFLRAYRDRCLRDKAIGSAIIWLYYNFAPYPAYIVERIPFLKRFSRKRLDQIVHCIEKNTDLKREDFR